MSTNAVNKKKTSRERKVLIGAICTAAAITAGSTFAWFTSQDTVTNKLSATGDYGVTITEDFTPPTEWFPGQSIEKKAKAINTGNVDAFVRMWLTGTMRVVSDGGTGSTTSAGTFDPSTLQGASMGGKFQETDGAGKYYRTLGDDERKTLQTADLIYAEAGYTADNVATDPGPYDNNGGVDHVDSDSFTPTGDGLYIFRRSNNGTKEYSGYYHYGSKYYALETLSNDDVKNVYIKGLEGLEGAALMAKIKDAATVKVREATLTEYTNDNLTWTYTEPATTAASPFGTTNPYYTVSIAGAAAPTASIVTHIELANIGNGTAADQWQRLSAAGKIDTFYYTNDLESGTETEQLVANVKLDEGIAAGAYVAFDFDLDVNLESIQIVMDTAKKESAGSITGGWAPAATGTGADVVKASAAPNVTGSEITNIAWSVTTP